VRRRGVPKRRKGGRRQLAGRVCQLAWELCQLAGSLCQLALSPQGSGALLACLSSCRLGPMLPAGRTTGGGKGATWQGCHVAGSHAAGGHMASPGGTARAPACQGLKVSPWPGRGVTGWYTRSGGCTTGWCTKWLLHPRAYRGVGYPMGVYHRVVYHRVVYPLGVSPGLHSHLGCHRVVCPQGWCTRGCCTTGWCTPEWCACSGDGVPKW